MSVLTRPANNASEWVRRNPGLLLIPVSVLIGAALAVSASPLIVGVLLAIVPVVMLQIAFVRNLFIGIIAYLIVEYLQPGHRIPVLALVRPALLVAGSLLLAWVLNAAQHRTKLVLNWQVKSYIIFLLLGTLSAYSAVSTGMVLKTLIVMAKSLAVFFIMYSVVNTIEKLRALIWTYSGLHCILAILAFGLFFTTGQRNFGDLGASFLGDENDSAMALLIMIPYSFFMLRATKHKLIRTVLVVGMVFSSAAVLFSFSRGAFVGFMSMVIYMWAKSPRKRLTAVVLAIFVAGLFAVMPGEYWERIESTKEYGTEGSAQGRIDAWKGGINMMLDNPMFGAGLGNFNRVYGTEYNTISARWTAAHSLYIQFIGELGVPGLIFIVTTILLTFRTIRTVRRGCRGRTEPEFVALATIVTAAECGFVAYLVSTTFLNSMAHPHLWHFGAVAGCALLAFRDLEQRLGPGENLSLIEPRQTDSMT
jgi:probable O-glycosylation ligase (exosortase A-associated)